MDLQKIRAITDADVSLAVVEPSVFDALKKRNPVYVAPRQLKYSAGVLISKNFIQCQGVGFVDGTGERGALAHNYSSDDPAYFLTGKCKSENIEDPTEIFPDRSRVTAIHVYRRYRYNWSEQGIEDALRSIGIERIIHIPIHGRWKFYQHIALDVRERRLYVFPTDLDYGICFKVE